MKFNPGDLVKILKGENYDVYQNKLIWQEGKILGNVYEGYSVEFADDHGDKYSFMFNERNLELIKPTEQDNVNHPSHYTQSGIECIEAIKASMSKEEFAGYLKGNTIKYLWRYRLKGKAQEDLQKADWYLKRLLTENKGE